MESLFLEADAHYRIHFIFLMEIIFLIYFIGFIYKKKKKPVILGQEWWCSPLVPALGRQRQSSVPRLWVGWLTTNRRI